MRRRTIRTRGAGSQAGSSLHEKLMRASAPVLRRLRNRGKSILASNFEYVVRTTTRPRFWPRNNQIERPEADRCDFLRYVFVADTRAKTWPRLPKNTEHLGCLQRSSPFETLEDPHLLDLSD